MSGKVATCRDRRMCGASQRSRSGTSAHCQAHLLAYSYGGPFPHCLRAVTISLNATQKRNSTRIVHLDAVTAITSDQRVFIKCLSIVVWDPAREEEGRAFLCQGQTRCGMIRTASVRACPGVYAMLESVGECSNRHSFGLVRDSPQASSKGPIGGIGRFWPKLRDSATGASRAARKLSRP